MVSLAALAGAPSTAPAAGPALQIAWKPATTANYTRANRPRSLVRTIVVHVTEGSYFGSISWLRNPRARASAHYVVSRGGAIAQLVRNSDIAWHAGNWRVNRESIGIEHEGYTYRKGSFTDVEYRTSARLSGWLARTYLLPIDRRRFIGHDEVPDPNNARLRGGFSHHTDPGPNWDWKRYLSYVRTYARGGTPPVFHAPKPAPAPVRPDRTKPTVIRPGGKAPAIGPLSAFAGLKTGARLTGFVPWRAGVTGSGIRKVEFLVDGMLRWTQKRAPYRYGGSSGLLDTTQLANGRHLLGIRVTTTKGKVSGSSLRVAVQNTPFQVTAVSPANGQVVGGAVRVLATVAGGTADRVEFVVDGRLQRTERSAPYEHVWETAKAGNGAHTLTLRGVAEDGRVATSSVTVVVENAAAPAPPPKPGTTIAIRGQSLRDGQTVSGSPRWSADVRGRDVERVEFWVDGVLRWTEGSRSPWVFNGDSGRWNTRSEANGRHVLTVKAVAVSGAESSSTVVVHVENAAVQPLAVRAPLPDGASVTGTVHVVAPVDGSPDRVEFWIDGALRHTERSAPYEFDWNTAKERPGTHTLLIRAIAGERSTTFTQTLTVPAPPETPLAVSLPLEDGQILAATKRLTVSAAGSPERVELWIDGTLRLTDRSAPYVFDWDTRRDGNGAHAVVAKAVAGDRSATASATVVVENAAAPALTVALPLADGQQVAGGLHVVAAAAGNPSRVEFWVDGTLRHTERSAPYEFDWDTRRERDGPHVFAARAYRDGARVEATVRVTVANAAEPTPEPAPEPPPEPTPEPAPPAFAVASSLVDGGTVSGTLRVSATVTGTARRVEIWIDGRRRAVDYRAPFTFDWNTTYWPGGAHTVVVRARSSDGTVAETSATVVVANGT